MSRSIEVVAVFAAAVLAGSGAVLVALARAVGTRAGEQIEQQARDLLEARRLLDEVRGELAAAAEQRAAVVAGLGQELHAPLTVVLASTRALLESSSALTGRPRELAESASRNSERAARIVDNIVASADANGGSRGLLDVIALVRSAADRRAIVHVNSPGPLYAVGDAGKVRAALDRLLADAASTPERHPTIGIGTGGTGRVYIEVDLTEAPSDTVESFGIFLTRRLLAGTGARIVIDPARPVVRIELPGLSMGQHPSAQRTHTGSLVNPAMTGDQPAL